MNTGIKIKWLEALRSGRYSQGTGKLNKNGKFCCLGVLCDIYGKENNLDWQPAYDLEGCSQLEGTETTTHLETHLLDWSGLTQDEASSLINMNDSGNSFNTIADAIETRL